MVNKEGGLLSNSKKIADKLENYFNQLLNSESSVNQREYDDEGEPTNNSLECEEVEPSRVEIEMII